MKRIGIVSYNIHCNFTNYGSALQSWALSQAVKVLGYEPVLVDYCPDILADKNPLEPFSNMWDRDEESQKMCALTLPAIRVNYNKFESFYNNQFHRSKPYTKINFEQIMKEVDSFVCGSDTIFSPDEFGLDDGYLANYDCMKGNSVAYAASFGDPHFSEESFIELNKKILNFKALGIREDLMIPYLRQHTTVPVQKVIDPTLLLSANEYKKITFSDRLVQDKYVLYYSRRYNPAMETFVERLAAQNGWRVVEISLRATNISKGHIMYYQAGVEEFLALIRDAEFVVTNSFHGMIFSVQLKKEFVIFSRELCDTKIIELLDMFGLRERMLISGKESFPKKIDYQQVHNRINMNRKNSIEFLKKELELLSC